MDLSGSYEHKDIDSNNNNSKKNWNGTQRRKNLFDTFRYIVTCLNRMKISMHSISMIFLLWSFLSDGEWSAVDILIVLYTTWLNSGFFSQAFAEILDRKFIPVS